MSSLPASPRRLVVAITAAVASTTLAVGVTAASLMGWFTPASSAPAPAEPAVVPPVVLVPVAPSPPAPATTPLQSDLSDAELQLAMDEPPRRRDDDADDDDEHHERGDRHEDDDE